MTSLSGKIIDLEQIVSALSAECCQLRERVAKTVADRDQLAESLRIVLVKRDDLLADIDQLRSVAEVAAAQAELNFAGATAEIEDIEYLAVALEDLRNELYAAVLSIDGEASTNRAAPR